MTKAARQNVARPRKRQSRKHRLDLARYQVTVSASALRTSRMGPRFSWLDPEGECRSTITIEGSLDQPVLRIKTPTFTSLRETEMVAIPVVLSVPARFGRWWSMCRVRNLTICVRWSFR